MSFYLHTPGEVVRRVGGAARDRRLRMGLRQADLAARTGVTLSTIRRFEAGTNVGFEAVVRIATALECAETFAGLFPRIEITRLDELLAAPRRRARAARR